MFAKFGVITYSDTELCKVVSVIERTAERRASPKSISFILKGKLRWSQFH